MSDGDPLLLKKGLILASLNLEKYVPSARFVVEFTLGLRNDHGGKFQKFHWNIIRAGRFIWVK